MLIAENIDDTVKFYCDKIGFELGFIIRDAMIPFACLYRDNVSLNFREGKISSPPRENGGIVLQVNDFDDFYEEIKKHGALNKVSLKTIPQSGNIHLKTRITV